MSTEPSANGSCIPLPITVPRGDVAQAGELTDIGVEGEVRRPGSLERVAEVARVRRPRRAVSCLAGRRSHASWETESSARAV